MFHLSLHVLNIKKCLSACLSVRLSVSLSVCLLMLSSVCLSICFVALYCQSLCFSKISFPFLQDTVGQLSLSNLATWNEFISVEKMVPEASDVGCSAIPVFFCFLVLIALIWETAGLLELLYIDCLKTSFLQIIISSPAAPRDLLLLFSFKVYCSRSPKHRQRDREWKL